MEKTLWTADAQPVAMPLNSLMYAMRREDEGGLLLDAVSLGDLMSDPDVQAMPTAMLDALVVEVSRLSQKMAVLQRTMESAGGAVKPTGFQISDAVKLRGTMQVAVLYTMADGQTVTVWFHNPDTTPTKLMPLDELISWKFMLNKKDITIVVAPERGRDLNVREVARRIMRLVERNSAAFVKANAKLADKIAAETAIDGEIAALGERLGTLQAQIADAKLRAEHPPEPKAVAVDEGQNRSMMPETVKTAIRFQVGRLQDIAQTFDRVIAARGRGWTLALEVKDRVEEIAKAKGKLAEIYELSTQHGVTAEFDEIVAEAGGVPDFTSYGEPATTAAPEPVVETPTEVDASTSEPAVVTPAAAPFMAFHVDGVDKFTIIVKNDPSNSAKDARSDAIGATRTEFGGGAVRVKEEAIPLDAVPEGAWEGKGGDWVWFMRGYLGETAPAVDQSEERRAALTATLEAMSDDQVRLVAGSAPLSLSSAANMRRDKSDLITQIMNNHPDDIQAAIDKNASYQVPAAADAAPSEADLANKRTLLQDFLAAQPDSPNADAWHAELARINGILGEEASAAPTPKLERRTADEGMAPYMQAIYDLQYDWASGVAVGSTKAIGAFKTRLRGVAKTVPASDEKATMMIDLLVTKVWGTDYDPKVADVQFAVEQAPVALGADWERDVIDQIIEQGEMDNGDAQSVFEAQPAIVEAQRAARSDAATTATAILAAGIEPSTVEVASMAAQDSPADGVHASIDPTPVILGREGVVPVSGEMVDLGAEPHQVSAVPLDPALAADRAYLESLIDGSGDLLAEDTFDRMEPLFAKYEGNAEMEALLERAAETYSAAAVAAAQAAIAAPV